MDEDYFRRKASLCLRLAQATKSPDIADQFRVMAADYAEQAADAEYIVSHSDDRSAPILRG